MVRNDNLFDHSQFRCPEAEIARQADRIQPELRGTLVPIHMDVGGSEASWLKK